jgi:hypothetical protein
MIDQYLDELEHELRLAARRRVRLAVARAPRTHAGTVAGVCALAVCVLVVFAVLQAGARRAGGGSSSGSSGSSVVVPAGARALVDELGVFRRPQAAADRIDVPIPHLFVLESVTHPPAPGPENLKIVPSLTRLVARLPGGKRVFLAIGRVAGIARLQAPTLPRRVKAPSSLLHTHPRATLRASPPHYVVVWLELPFADYVPVPSSDAHRSRRVLIGRNQSLLASPALTAGALLQRGQTASPPEGIPDDPINGLLTGPKTWLAIVPDSVARARWAIQYPGRRHRVQVTLPVSDNVALLRVPNGQMDQVWALTWLAADGHAIETLSYPVEFQ